MTRLPTWDSALPYLGDPDGPDTTAGITDSDIARALVEEPTALGCAVLLTDRHGGIVVTADDVRARIAASPALQRVQDAARDARMAGAIARCRQIAAERIEARRRTVAEWERLHRERVALCDLRRQRNHGPRCGAKTRAGRPCIRRPVLGRRRCPNHGGLSTGPRTPDGRARALAALQRGRETQRAARERQAGARQAAAYAPFVESLRAGAHARVMGCPARAGRRVAKPTRIESMSRRKRRRSPAPTPEPAPTREPIPHLYAIDATDIPAVTLEELAAYCVTIEELARDVPTIEEIAAMADLPPATV